LVSINELREKLGMPLVDEQLREQPATSQASAPSSGSSARSTGKSSAEAIDPHREARALYLRYQTKRAELQRYRDYADRVADATEGAGMTPVMPLATMGENNGPLLCDYCRKPIVLEGGQFHGKTADVAYKAHPNPTDDWVSWILGGMVVEIQTNQTLRIYHGYPRQRDACCSKAAREDEKARAAFDGRQWFIKEPIMAAFVEQELLPEGSERERRDLTAEILDVLFAYDPGLGVNRP
jgi:hypothetical protein